MKSRPFFLLLLLLGSRLSAQDYVIGLQHWGVREGLSDRQVNCMVKDRRGLIWLGTRYGLNRFDGYDFTACTREHNGLPFNDIQNVVVDAKGLLWLRGRTLYRNLAVFDPVSNKILPPEETGGLPGRDFAYLESGTDGTIYAGLNGDTSFFSFRHNSGWQKILLPAEMQPERSLARNVFITSRGSICMIREKHILYEWNVEKKVLRKTIFPEEVTDYCYYSPEGDIYLTGPQSCYCFSSSTGDFKRMDDQLPPHDYDAVDFIFDTHIDNILWRQGKLYHLKRGLLKDFGKEGIIDLKGNLRNVATDGKGRFWLCSEAGLYLLEIKTNKFTRYFYDAGARGNSSYRSMITDNGVLYACNETMGWVSIPLEQKIQHQQPFFPTSRRNKPVANYRIVKAGENYLLGSCNHGFYYAPLPFNRKKLQLIPINRPVFDENTWALYELKPNLFFAGTGNGLAWLDMNSREMRPFTQYNRYDELRTATVLHIMPDRQGQIWLCSNTGLYAYDTLHGISARYSSADTGAFYLPCREVQHFCEDSEGIFWIAASEGLVKWDRKKKEHAIYTRAEGLSNNNIYAVYEDAYGMLWLSSDYGIMRFNRKNGSVKTYLASDGITDNEFNRIAHYSDPAGNLYFGSLNGITAFHPSGFVADDNVSNKKPLLAITSFQQFSGMAQAAVNRTAELVRTGTVTVQPADGYLNFDFSLLSFEDVAQTRYYWKIDGADDKWNVQRERSLRLGRLPYGNHTLYIKAQAADGAWSDGMLSIRLHVLRPFYLQGWFLAACSLLVIFLIMAWNRRRTYHLNKENERLDAMVREKTQHLALSLHEKEILMKEIHHRVKNNLQMISGLLQLQSYGLTDKQAKEALSESQNRVFSIALIHQKLYQHEQLDSVEFSAFAGELFTQLAGVFIRKEKTVAFDNRLPECYMDIDLAVPLGLILNELITNSFKYAFGNQPDPLISLQLQKNDGGLSVLEYTDNGPGFPLHIDPQKSKSFGIRLINRLSTQLDGRMEYHYDNGRSVFLIWFRV